MKKTKQLIKICVLALITHFMLIPNSKAQTALSQDPIYHLAFSDDFNGTGPDTSSWWSEYYGGWSCNQNDSIYRYQNWYHHNNVGKEIDQDYSFPNFNNTDNNLAYYTSGSGTGSGYISLTTRHHNPPISEPIHVFKSPYPPYNDTVFLKNVPFKFTTASLFGRYKFKYGYVEMSFRTSPFDTLKYNAYSPNFWMWGGDSTTAYSEIDISEMEGRQWTTAPEASFRHFPNIDANGNHIPPPGGYGYGPQDTVKWEADDFWDYNKTYTPYQRHHTPVNTPFIPGNWHTIGCEWTPDYVDIYYYTVSSDTFQRFSVNKFPVNKLCAMPILIDNYTPALRDSFIIPFDSVKTRMPFNYDIDYVHVYQV